MCKLSNDNGILKLEMPNFVQKVSTVLRAVTSSFFVFLIRIDAFKFTAQPLLKDPKFFNNDD